MYDQTSPTNDQGWKIDVLVVMPTSIYDEQKEYSDVDKTSFRIYLRIWRSSKTELGYMQNTI